VRSIKVTREHCETYDRLVKTGRDAGSNYRSGFGEALTGWRWWSTPVNQGRTPRSSRSTIVSVEERLDRIKARLHAYEMHDPDHPAGSSSGGREPMISRRCSYPGFQELASVNVLQELPLPS
jgi:hypothetical protein